jgi:hypothetical protein
MLFSMITKIYTAQKPQTIILYVDDSLLVVKARKIQLKTGVVCSSRNAVTYLQVHTASQDREPTETSLPR